MVRFLLVLIVLFLLVRFFLKLTFRILRAYGTVVTGQFRNVGGRTTKAPAPVEADYEVIESHIRDKEGRAG